MDWDLAIKKNREGLKRILAMLVSMAAFRPEPPVFASGGDLAQDAACHSEAPPTLPRRLHRAVLRLLRPAESAARRLVIIAARDIVVAPPPHRPAPPPMRVRRSAFVKSGTGIILPRGMRAPGKSPPRTHTSMALPLLDPPRRIGQRRPPTARDVPRISSFGYGAPRPFAIRPPPQPDDPLDATRISLRLAALAATLDDLAGAARRFARWRVRRDAALAAVKAARTDRSGAKGPPARRMRLWALRPGRPPGSLRRSAHEVHHFLKETHGLACWVLGGSDTS